MRRRLLPGGPRPPTSRRVSGAPSAGLPGSDFFSGGVTKGHSAVGASGAMFARSSRQSSFRPPLPRHAPEEEHRRRA
jgi:hypothetical protein